MIVSNFRRSILMVLAVALSTLCGSGLAGAEGFLGRYYSNTNLSGAPALTRVDPTINFNWGSQSPATGVPADNFSVRWVGYLTPPTSGIWTFTTASDDGISLVVNGQTVVRDGTAHAVKEQSGSIELQAGVPVLVDLTYYEASGLAVAQLYWSGPSVPKQVVPATVVQAAESPLLYSTVPTASETSPAFVEARALAGGPVTLTANGAPAPMVSNGVHFFANIPLNTKTAVATSLSVGGQVLNRAIAWQPISLEGDKSRVVRVGDSLLLQAVSAGTWRSIRGSGVGYPVKACKAGDRFPVSFTQPGIYEFVAFNTAGAEVGSLVVNAMSVDFGAKIACEVGFKRDKEIKVLGGDFAFLSFSSADPLLIDITPKGPSTEGGEIYLQPFRRGTPVVYARVGGPKGAILASKEIDEFTLANTARPGGLINDETSLTSATLTITPFIPDLWFNFSMFAHRSTFKGGAKTFKINTSQALSSLGEAGFTTTTNASGETTGQFQYTLEVPPGETKSCLRAIPQQINSPPKDVGYSTAYNGCWCRVTAEHIELKEGETKPMEINVVKACPDGSVYQTITTAGSVGPSPPYARGNNVDCKVPGPVSGVNVECATFKVYPTGTTGPYPGKYTFYIGGAKWEDLIWVYPGCKATPGVNQSGSITKRDGEVYFDDDRFTPPLTELSFEGTGKDTDTCDGKNVEDTYLKNGAITWTVNAGVATKENEICTKLKWKAPGVGEACVIKANFKDDGIYAQDTNTWFSDYRVTVYALTGVSVRSVFELGTLSKQQPWQKNSAVMIKAKEITNQTRPTLQFYLKDENGNEIANTPKRIAEDRIVIAKPGRYRFGVRNTARPSEQFETEQYVFFTLSFKEEGATHNWDPESLRPEGIGPLEKLGDDIIADINTYEGVLSGAKAAAQEVPTAVSRIRDKANADITRSNQEATRLQSLNDADAQLKARWEQIVATNKPILERLKREMDVAEAIYAAARATGSPDWPRLYLEFIAAAGRYVVFGASVSSAQQLADEIGRRMAARATEIAKLIERVRGWRAFLSQFAPKSMGSMRTLAPALREIASANGVLGIAGISLDIDEIGQSSGKIQDAYERYKDAEKKQAEYLKLLENLKAAEREKGPVLEIMTVQSVPGEVKFKFNLGTAQFTTYDTRLGASKNESMWGWKYLAEVDGQINGWTEEHATDSEGKNTFVLTLWGNIGDQKIGLTESTDNYMLSSVGMKEDEVLRLADQALARSKAVTDAIKEGVRILLNTASIILSIISIIVILTGAGALVVAALTVCVEVVKLCLDWFTKWATESTLEQTIKQNFPK